MRLPETAFITPDWPAPAGVRAVQTTRLGGVSQGPYASLNLGAYCGDEPSAVETNRARVHASLSLPAGPSWMDQVHGTRVSRPDAGRPAGESDAAVCTAPGVVLAVLSADCLPVLMCDRVGTTIAAVHAGWRGLAAGVIEAAIAEMPVPPSSLMAWLGPAIGRAAYEVGAEVRDAFLAHDPAASAAFVQGRADRWHADLCTLARQRLDAAGVNDVHGIDRCTVADAGRFYSYRRDGITGRMATLIWRE